MTWFLGENPLKSNIIKTMSYIVVFIGLWCFAINKVITTRLILGASNQYMIRVLRLGSTERTLLKGFTGAVTDLAFAHLDSTLLGCVDEAGNMFIWQLTSQNSKIQYLALAAVVISDYLQPRLDKLKAVEESLSPAFNTFYKKLQLQSPQQLQIISNVKQS